MSHIPSVNFLDKAHQRYRRDRANDPTLPAPIPGAGRVESNGKLCVVLPRVDGTTVTYSFQPVTEWRLTQEPKHHGAGSPAPTEASPSDRARYALDVLRGVVADAQHRIAAE